MRGGGWSRNDSGEGKHGHSTPFGLKGVCSYGTIRRPGGSPLRRLTRSRLAVKDSYVVPINRDSSEWVGIYEIGDMRGCEGADGLATTAGRANMAIRHAPAKGVCLHGARWVGIWDEGAP